MGANEISVFFYGLFMDTSMLASRGIHATDPAVAWLDGYRLRIGERATLLPEPGSRAYGLLMNMTPEDVQALYSEPSVADYAAEPVVARLPGDIRVPAVCYNLPAAKLVGTNPGYAAALLSLATRLGLPNGYLEEIRSFV